MLPVVRIVPAVGADYPDLKCGLSALMVRTMHA